MATEDTEALQDRPIRDKGADELERGPFVESLVRALVRDERDREGHLVSRRSTGYVVGLTGRWGLGKSSVLNLIEQRLSGMPHVTVATFNPWLFKGREELLNGFFDALRDSMGRSVNERVRDLRTNLDRYWAAIGFAGNAVAAAADAHGAAGTATTLWGSIKALWPGKPAPLSLLQERRALEQKLLSLNEAVVVLIDELDRVEDEEVRAVAQLVKAVGDIRGISYLVAYDPERVADALGRGKGSQRREHGERYLEKIIQHAIPLRPLFDEDVSALLSAALRAHAVDMPAPSKTQSAVFDAIKRSIQSPRDVKRLIGSFAVIEAAVRGEVCPFDVLAYSWILAKAPTLRDLIAANPDKFVDDPTSEEMAARVSERLDKKGKPSPQSILGSAAIPYDDLLRLLFPRFGKSRNDNEEQGTRISRRRNLIRLLYLGNPPTMISRAEIERLWGMVNASDLDFELQQLAEKDLVPSLLDRLDDLAVELPASGDRTFWPAISRLATRSTDWIKRPETGRSIVADAGTVLLHLAMRNPANASRVKAAIEILISAGDLLLVPYILRKHLFHFGMTKHSTRAHSEPMVLTLEETRELLARETPRYKAAIVSGVALRRLPNLEAMYVLGNANLFDKDLRTALTAQLEGGDAIATFAALVVPPGFSAERNALNEFFDADAVKEKIAKLGDLTSWIDDPWVRAAVGRLNAILAGRDPMFDHEGASDDRNSAAK